MLFRSLLVFRQMGLNGPELLKELVVLQNFEVLDVEIGFVVAFELLFGFARVDTFKDAESAEVLQRDLHIADGV